MKCQDITWGRTVSSRFRSGKQQTGDQLSQIQRVGPWNPPRSMLGGGSENPRAGHDRCQLRVQRPSPGLGTRGAAKELETGLHKCQTGQARPSGAFGEYVRGSTFSAGPCPMLSPRPYLTPNTTGQARPISGSGL